MLQLEFKFLPYQTQIAGHKVCYVVVSRQASIKIDLLTIWAADLVYLIIMHQDFAGGKQPFDIVLALIEQSLFFQADASFVQLVFENLVEVVGENPDLQMLHLVILEFSIGLVLKMSKGLILRIMPTQNFEHFYCFNAFTMGREFLIKINCFIQPQSFVYNRCNFLKSSPFSLHT